MVSAGRYTALDPSQGSSHTAVLELVPAGARVLEFGCAPGYMSAALKSGLGCSVVGVELSPEAAALAREHCDEVIVGDAEELDLAALLPGRRFDAVLFADVLEHLRSPGTLLRRVRSLLAEGGAVIASIPNVAHGSVRLALLGGRFRYQKVGLLDDTHLRFFTRESVLDLFESAGYRITEWGRTLRDIDDTEVDIPADVPRAVREWVERDGDATTYQFVVRAVPDDSAETVRQRRIEEARWIAEQEEAQLVDRAVADLLKVVRPGSTFVLVDDDVWGLGETVEGRRRLPFLERNGEYWGPPADDEEAVEELERMRRDGADFFVVARSCRWFLRHYERFADHVRTRFPCVLDDDRLVVFDLR